MKTTIDTTAEIASLKNKIMKYLGIVMWILLPVAIMKWKSLRDGSAPLADIPALPDGVMPFVVLILICAFETARRLLAGEQGRKMLHVAGRGWVLFVAVGAVFGQWLF